MAGVVSESYVGPKTAQVPAYKLNKKTGESKEGPKVPAEVSLHEVGPSCDIEVKVLPKGKQPAADTPMISDTVSLSSNKAAPFLKALNLPPNECQDKVILMTTSRPDTSKKAPTSDLPVFRD